MPLGSLGNRGQAKAWLRRLFRRTSGPIYGEVERRLRRQSFPSPDVVAQKVLMQQYRICAASDRENLPSFPDAGFRKHSQFDEDGILLYIFSLIPALYRKCIELGAGSGGECNTANLILNHGWWGWLFDGDERNVLDGQSFFADHQDSFLCPPRFVASWLTAERIDEVLVTAGVSGPVDLLSIDIDGMD